MQADLEPILKRTYGVPISRASYGIAVVAAGLLRVNQMNCAGLCRRRGCKRMTMDGVRDRIMTGLAAKGISQEYGEQIYKTIEGFSTYGFPESHAASFALLTYASCYLNIIIPMFLFGIAEQSAHGILRSPHSYF